MKAVGHLIRGLALQLVCYLGQFLVLAIAIRALSPADFGRYASAVATAALLGSVLTLGADRLLLRKLSRRRSTAGYANVHALLLPFLAINAVVLFAAAALAFFGRENFNIAFISALAVLISARIVVSADFKRRGKTSLNVLATFGLQPLVVALIYLPFVTEVFPDSGFSSELGNWYVATLACEIVQFIFFLSRTRSPLRPHEGPVRYPKRVVFRSLQSGFYLSLWAILSQTALLSVAAGSLLLNPVQIGIYTLGVRIAQLLAFPYIGATQLLIPLSIRTYSPPELKAASREILVILRLATLLIALGLIIFALAGELVTLSVFNTSSPLLYQTVLILGLGNVLMAAFGGADQIMVSAGLQRAAFRISVATALLFIVLLGGGVALGGDIFALAIATFIPLVARCVLAYMVARRRLSVPIAVWDQPR